MSGPVSNNVFRSSGVIASAAGGLSWQDVVTASTVTVEAGNGYPIDTTSNTCTITLPSSASAGDQIIFLDYARTWGTNKIIIDSNGLKYQGDPDTYPVEYDTDGQTVSIVYSGATVGWIPESDVDVTDAPVQPPTQKALFAFGYTTGQVNMSNLVSSSGVVATDTTGVGTARSSLAAANYGVDKAIFGFGYVSWITGLSLTNLVSNSGVVATDTSGVGGATGRAALAGASYGGDKAIFAYGIYAGPTYTNLSNLISNSGVVATDTTGVGTSREGLAGCEFGTDRGIFAYGTTGSKVSMSNLVSNVGVVGADVSGVGTTRSALQGAAYAGKDKGIFRGGTDGSVYVSLSNLVSNTGVVATDTTGVGTARASGTGTDYGGDKGIFGFGYNQTAITNLISSSGVVSTDVTGVGTGRDNTAAAGYSATA